MFTFTISVLLMLIITEIGVITTFRRSLQSRVKVGQVRWAFDSKQRPTLAYVTAVNHYGVHCVVISNHTFLASERHDLIYWSNEPEHRPDVVVHCGTVFTVSDRNIGSLVCTLSDEAQREISQMITDDPEDF